MFNIKWRFVVDISGSLNKMGDGAKTRLKLYDPVVKVGEGWVDLEPMLLVNCKVAK
jgi:hypothetical protein